MVKKESDTARANFTVAFGQVLSIRSTTAQPPTDLTLSLNALDKDFGYCHLSTVGHMCWRIFKSSDAPESRNGGLWVDYELDETQEISVVTDRWRENHVLYLYVDGIVAETGELRVKYVNPQNSYRVPRKEKE